MEVLDAREWEHYLSRPASLFLASVWQKWYSSGLKEVLGTDMRDCLMVEEKEGISGNYVPREQLRTFWEKTREVMQDHERIRSILLKGKELNARAEALLTGTEELDSLREGLNFIIDLGIHATQMPRAVLMDGDDLPGDLRALAQDLRSVSFYPRIVNEVLVPLAQEEYGLDEETVLNSAIEDILEERKREQGEGYFVYAVIDGATTIQWIDDVRPILKHLRDLPEDSDDLKGQVAHPGNVRGTVRIVDTNNYRSVAFNEGDILVSINSSPTYMALIRRAGALVTDEGGLGCHAAIVSRELGKPCVIGTQHATSVLKKGEKVEVDADNGIVRKIK